MVEIKLLSDKSEVVSYNFLDFSICAKQASLSDYPAMAAVNHWHSDWEFIIILSGKMSYSVNRKSYELQEGQGIFINSEQMHYGYSADGSDCSFICIMLPPNLISSITRIKETYVLPICSDASHPFFILHTEIPCQGNLIEILKNLYKLCNEEKAGFELHVMSLFHSLCYSLYHNMKDNISTQETTDDKKLEAMHNMIGYIQQNYQKKITLNEIAASGNVCRSNCCDIFQLILNKTPVSYLTEYRLEKSIDLLNIPSLSVTEIALQCGFTGSSYFTEIFHKKLGCTPSQYRKSKVYKVK
ncbi:virulence regulon transcriptional activator VirF [Clostridium puniceum]|uniref:Virulence regulon transcriptional activator VirF n=1 Tax=Clostridium puniceum TaxID=29367 RepID=A0A1S8T7I5_9CLOT|nr:AraC family transcriptional regulator [Clostridium puniceum]OOM73658.1 virulence regulon transcriptional activator VirF [Clostridium puniceum]